MAHPSKPPLIGVVAPEPPPPQVKAMFDGHKPYLTWSREVEGNRVEGGRMTLGMRSGPSYSICALLHEMSHLIEIDDARCHLHGWGLVVPEVEAFGRIFQEPATFQCSIREMRVISIQFVLSKHLRVPMDLAEWGSFIKYLPDWWAFRSYFDRSDDVQLDSSAWSKLVVDDIHHRVAALTVDDILSEWDRKCRLVREALQG